MKELTIGAKLEKLELKQGGDNNEDEAIEKVEVRKNGVTETKRK